MSKYFKTIVIILLLTLSIPHVALAVEPERPPKPTEGVESFYPDRGSSWDAEGITNLSASLISEYGCTIKNNGSNLSLTGTTTARYIVDKVSLTLYLQKWEGTKWVDVRSFAHSKSNIKSINDGNYIYSFERGNYYRTRAVHYVKDGSETDFKYSVSSYIYVN